MRIRVCSNIAISNRIAKSKLRIRPRVIICRWCHGYAIALSKCIEATEYEENNKNCTDFGLKSHFSSPHGKYYHV